MDRRKFLKGTGALLAVLGVGGLRPALGQASAQVPSVKDVEDLENLNKGLKEALGITFDKLEPSDKVVINAPKIAESGANVPVEVSAALPPSEVKALHCFVDRNPFPHLFTTEFGPKAAETYFATRIRIAETAPIRMVLETKDGRYLLASHVTRVTVGGCG